MSTGEDHQRRNFIQNPIIQEFHWMCKMILGRMRETKITNTELNWLYSALIAKKPINPTHLWSTGGVVSNIGFGRSGCYLSMLAIFLRPGIARNPNHVLAGTSLGFENMKKANI
jgi:hypothetical protein